MLDEPLQRFPRQVEPVEGGITLFELGDDAQRLGIMIEAAVRQHQRVEHVFAGMAEGRVAEVMRERQRLGEVVIEAERPGDGAGDLANFDRMGQTGAIMIALMRHEDLRLMGEAAKGR